MTDRIIHDQSTDGIDRRGFLKCMAWVGSGLVWTLSGGILSSCSLGATEVDGSDFSFVQISDSHIGFDKEPNYVTTTSSLAIVDSTLA